MINLVSDKPHYENVPFEIPETWEWVTLGAIGTWQAGGTPNRGVKEYYGGDIPWLKTGDLNDGYITNIPECITKLGLEKSSAKLNPKDSVLIAMYGATIGKVGILTFPATTNQACCACIEYPAVDKLYLYYFLLSHREIFISRGGGGAQPNISKEIILATQFPLPPHAEQQRIVAEVEKWFTLIDTLEENKEDLKDYIKQVKSKVLSLAISGKLVPQDPNDEPAIELLKRINPNFKPCDTSHYENLPNGWYICDLLDICNISTGKWDANHATENGKYRFYTCSSKHSYSDTKRFSGECLIVPGNGDIGAVYYYKGDFDAYQRTYVLHDVKIFTPYLYYHFLSNWRQINDDKMYGSTIKFVRISNFQNYKVLIPPYEEQIKIVEYLEQFFIFINTISAEL